MCPHVVNLVNHMKQFVYDTSTGARPTLARWMRNFVDKHPEYTHNSILPRKVMNDMLMTLHKIEIGQKEDKTFAKIFPEWQFEEGSKPKCFPQTVEV